jgi:hypothetical protein
MKILILTVKDATQAKLSVRPGQAIIKIPGHLVPNVQTEVRDKLIKVAELNKDTKEFLKLYYKVGTPYLFLNRKISASKKETAFVYKYAEL